MRTEIRKFEKKDIDDKIRWINDPRNNRYLHYDLPLEKEKTERWYERIKDRTDRFDAVICADGVPCGIAGLLNIDYEKSEAEFYITVGEQTVRHCGVGYAAGNLILIHAFAQLGLESVYLYTDSDNTAARGLFEKLGFSETGEFLLPRRSGGDCLRIIYTIDRKCFFGKASGNEHAR